MEWSINGKMLLTIVLSFLFAGHLIMSGIAYAEESIKAEGDRETPASGPEPVQSGVEKADHKTIVVARVNGADITMKSLMTMTNRMIEKNSRGGAEPGDIEKIRKDALDRLITQELALQDAKARGMAVEQKQVDDTFTNLKIGLGGDEEYKKYLEKEGITDMEARREVERMLLLQMIFNKKVKELNEKIVIDEDTLRKEYEKNESGFVRPEKIKVVDVVLFITAGDENADKIAGDVLRMIKDDKDNNPLNLVPDGTFIVRELEVEKSKHAILYEEARKLKEGELSGVIETPDSLHIIKLVQYSPEKRYSLDEVRAYLERKFRNEELVKRLREWETGLRNDAEIEIMDFDKIKN